MLQLKKLKITENNLAFHKIQFGCVKKKMENCTVYVVCVIRFIKGKTSLNRCNVRCHAVPLSAPTLKITQISTASE